MATVKTIIEKAYTKVNGEYEQVAESSDDFKTYLNVLNQVIEIWATTPYVKWQSLFDMGYMLPDPVVDGVFSYTVDDPEGIVLANTPFDSVYFVAGDGTIVDKYTMTDQALFQASDSPKICAFLNGKLYLKSTNENIVGASINLPVYRLPAQYTSASESVKIDNVPWLVNYMSAFISDASPVPFIARNAEKFYKQADVQMKTMRDNNRKSQHLVIKRYNDTLPHTWADVMNIMTLRDL